MLITNAPYPRDLARIVSEKLLEKIYASKSIPLASVAPYSSEIMRHTVEAVKDAYMDLLFPDAKPENYGVLRMMYRSGGRVHPLYYSTFTHSWHVNVEQATTASSEDAAYTSFLTADMVKTIRPADLKPALAAIGIEFVLVLDLPQRKAKPPAPEAPPDHKM